MGDQNVVLARYAERAERFDEMVEYMAARVKTGAPLDSEERDMFSAAFKSALSGRRNAVRVAVSFERHAEGGPAQATLAAGYRSKVEVELTMVCENAISLLSTYLITNADSCEAKTFYFKMMGDYYRYMAEFADDAKKQPLAENASHFYHQGLTEGMSLPTTHPTRLGLALNYSVFLHEVACKTDEAVDTAKGAFECAMHDVHVLNDEATKQEAFLTLRLLQDNLQLWCGAQ
jgi:14-3-3 protein epsilon